LMVDHLTVIMKYPVEPHVTESIISDEIFKLL
jgi:hypothetical protein